MTSEPNLGYSEVLGEAATNPPTPRTSGNVIYLLQQAWRVAPCEQRIKAQFEEWVRLGARRAINEADMEDGPEAAARMRSAYSGDFGAGHYNWDGRHCRSARGDTPGLKHLLLLLLRRCQPDVTEDMVSAMFREDLAECSVAIGWALGNSQAPAIPTPGQVPQRLGIVTVDERRRLWDEHTTGTTTNGAPPVTARPTMTTPTTLDQP